MSEEDYGFVGQNIAEIREKIGQAAELSGRKAEEITLLAVTKTIELPLIQKAVSVGVNELGENKVQELLSKCEHVAANWHLIGHLQTNKVKQVVGRAVLIHSVDSLKLAEEINKRAIEKDIIQSILVEVNISGEESKFGVFADKAKELVGRLWEMKGISVKGLMTVAPYVDDGEKNRDLFKKMRHLFVDINNERGDNEPMRHLSMGMTGDYETAILEGSTIVRIGTGIFGTRSYIRN